MKWQVALLAALLLATVVAFGCSQGGGSAKSTPSSSDATFQAALGDAAKTPVSESVRGYAKQLCPPLKAFLRDAGDTLSKLNKTSTPPATQSLHDVFTQAFGLFGDLRGPFKDLRDSLQDIDPPDDMKNFHRALIAELDYTVQAIDALSSAGLVGALALPTQEPTPESPPGFQAALLQECGDDLKPFTDQLGGLFGGGSAATPTATPPPPGVVGRAVRSGDYELLVNSVVDPYTSRDEFSQPDAGNRYVVADVSITNVSSDTKDYNSYDFKLRDSDSFQYDSTYSDVQQALSSGSLLAGETIRGRLSFQVPQSAQLTRLVFEPNFGFSGGRIDIALP
jgi:hypothetical protein